jgi:hypothetical protein
VGGDSGRPELEIKTHHGGRVCLVSHSLALRQSSGKSPPDAPAHPQVLFIESTHIFYMRSKLSPQCHLNNDDYLHYEEGSLYFCVVGLTPTFHIKP